MVEFKAFSKISRFDNNDWYITEKIDGTNAAVIIDEEGNVAAQSRTRIITPGKNTDNFGFAAWVEEHKECLKLLGPGYHFGEWWGKGIQHGYGLDEKRFSLFKWWQQIPDCCHRIPSFETNNIETALQDLKENGSKAAPGYMSPEGLVVIHKHNKATFKVIINKPASSR